VGDKDIDQQCLIVEEQSEVWTLALSLTSTRVGDHIITGVESQTLERGDQSIMAVGD
jgi:hypothetical protein